MTIDLGRSHNVKDASPVCGVNATWQRIQTCICKQCLRNRVDNSGGRNNTARETGRLVSSVASACLLRIADKRRKRRQIACSPRRGRYTDGSPTAGTLKDPLVVTEEEKFVLDDWTAERASEDVLAKLRL